MNDQKSHHGDSLEQQLRQSAAHELSASPGALKGRVLREIHARGTAPARREASAGHLIWAGLAGTLAAAALIAVVIWIGLKPTPLPAPVQQHAQNTMAAPLDSFDIDDLKRFAARAAHVSAPLEEEARKLRNDVERGYSFVKSKVIVARAGT